MYGGANAQSHRMALAEIMFVVTMDRTSVPFGRFSV